MFTSSSLTTLAALSNLQTWFIVSLVVAIAGGILAYVLFTSKKNKGEFKGFVAWLHSFLRFDKMTLETLVKVGYLVAAIYITLMSFGYISISFYYFILYITLGNIGARMACEAILCFIQIWKNSNDIKEALDKKSSK